MTSLQPISSVEENLNLNGKLHWISFQEISLENAFRITSFCKGISAKRANVVELWCSFAVSLDILFNKQSRCQWLRRHDFHMTWLWCVFRFYSACPAPKWRPWNRLVQWKKTLTFHWIPFQEFSFVILQTPIPIIFVERMSLCEIAGVKSLLNYDGPLLLG